MWRTTRPGRVPPNLAGFQSTSSVWRTTTGKDGETRKANISIHVLRVEDDLMLSPPSAGGADFNPRPPCGGRPHPLQKREAHTLYFNPRPPCGGRPRECNRWLHRPGISIHVLRVEDDAATAAHHKEVHHISIHVLRVEDDPGSEERNPRGGYFNPRPPCGGRPTPYKRGRPTR